uniref:Uncharacterized protein n=1 Tax=Arundo donax TaxID=35708 RepID=A0A0A9GSG2_ARUDO
MNGFGRLVWHNTSYDLVHLCIGENKGDISCAMLHSFF